jgi:hypothetical protein
MTKVKVFKKKVKGQMVKVMKGQMKGLARGNTHVKYESLPPTNQKLCPRLKFLNRRSNSKVKVSKSCYQIKGLATRNTLMKYESPTTYQSKVMTKDKVFEKKIKLQGQRSEGQGHGIK